MEKTEKRNPWWLVPTLYFAEGLPYYLVNSVSVILYKDMGLPNDKIAFWTSSLYLAWVIKMLWSSLVDCYSTKRSWIIYMQLLMSAVLFLVAFGVAGNSFFFMTMLGFAVGSFVSATQDIAIDGYYMLALDKKEQALFAGIRTAAYRLAIIFGSGLLVYLAGTISESYGSKPLGWSITFGIAAVLFLALFVYHRFVLPFPAEDRANAKSFSEGMKGFWEVFRSYFSEPNVMTLIFFTLFYRLAEAMLLKIAIPFLMDKPEAGGLGITTAQIGILYNTVGIIFMLLGGILGGWLISRFGLRKCIWPLVFALHIPDLLFVYMSYIHPGLPMVYVMVSLEQLGYGLGTTAFMVYLMYSSRGKYSTSYYAISTSIMALGMMVPGMVSGYIQKAYGYQVFFLLVCCTTIFGFATVPFVLKDSRIDDNGAGDKNAA